MAGKSKKGKSKQSKHHGRDVDQGKFHEHEINTLSKHNTQSDQPIPSVHILTLNNYSCDAVNLLSNSVAGS